MSLRDHNINITSTLWSLYMAAFVWLTPGLGGSLCRLKPMTDVGPLMGGPQCHMSILRNDNVACPCRLFYPMSHVEFKNRPCHILFNF